MGRSRSRSRDRDGRRGDRRSRSRSRDRDRRRERSRSRDRYRDQDRRDREDDRGRSGGRDRSRSRDHDGRKRGREEEKEETDDDRAGRGGGGYPRDGGGDDARAATTNVASDKNDAEAEKKRARLAAAKALMDKKRAAAAKEAAEHVAARAAAEASAERHQAAASAPPQTQTEDPDVDPLDAFMASTIDPEVRRREEEEAAVKRDAMLRRANEIKLARESGKEVKARADAAMLEDIDAETEDRPDECIELPDNKVKLVIGAGGENIKRIQKKSNCRLQVRKKSKDMSIGFGGTDQGGLMRERGGADADTAVQPDDVAGVTVFMLFGDADARSVAKRMIHELFDKAADAKVKQRQDEKDYKAKKRERARREYHLRHKKDYDVLGVSLGAPKDECRRAYRKLAVKWHPDKHPAGDGRVAAEAKFKEIQRAFDALMTTDEEQTIEALTAKGQKDAERAAKVSLFLLIFCMGSLTDLRRFLFTKELKKEAAKRDGVDLEAVAKSVAEVQERARKAAAEAKAREIEAAREAYRRM